VEISFFIDLGLGEPHIHRHGVIETDVVDALKTPRRIDGVEGAVGRDRTGRLLRVI
jgi:hypothetical protein